MSNTASEERRPPLNVELHAKYWQRCLKSFLPTVYTSNDSSRTSLAFFILSALDVLRIGADTFPESQQASIRSWFLRCQHPHGGFVGSPNHRYGDALYTDLHTADGRTVRQEREPANINATFFCLLSLAYVDGLRFVKRKECLRWLKKLQRPDGSFGEFLGKDGKIEGGTDTRHCLCAMGIRRVLRADLDSGQGYEDIDIKKMVGRVVAGATYDGGFSESPTHEAHGGYTYCALGALSMAGQLSTAKSRKHNTTNATEPEMDNLDQGLITRWLVARQMLYIDPNEEDDDGSDEQAPETEGATVSANLNDIEPLPVQQLTDESIIGYNGRFNKPADTCYCYWASSALDLLQQKELLQDLPLRKFLIEKTQHRIGGFGKAQGYPPDIYHSYLALGTLAIMGEPGLRSLDSECSVSSDVMSKIDATMERLLRR